MEFVVFINKSKPVIHKPIYFKKQQDSTIVEIAIQYVDGYNENIFGFVNTINTTEESITQLDNATTSTTTPEQESAAQTPNTTNTNYPLVLTDINKNIVHY